MSDLFQNTCPCCGQPLPESATETTFDAFWSKVQHKVNKAGAQKAWRKLTSAERQLATDRWPAFWSAWSKANPQASPIHPATYLNNRRWEDQAPAPQETLPRAHRLARQAEKIKSGKRFLCTQIPPNVARECIGEGLVSEAECKNVGVL